MYAAGNSRLIAFLGAYGENKITKVSRRSINSKIR